MPSIYGNEQCAPAREPEVNSAIAELQASIGYLADAVAVLEKRLTPITRPPSEDSKGVGARIACCAVSVSLFDSVAGVESLNLRLRELLDRLEI